MSDDHFHLQFKCGHRLVALILKPAIGLSWIKMKRNSNCCSTIRGIGQKVQPKQTKWIYWQQIQNSTICKEKQVNSDHWNHPDHGNFSIIYLDYRPEITKLCFRYINCSSLIRNQTCSTSCPLVPVNLLLKIRRRKILSYLFTFTNYCYCTHYTQIVKGVKGWSFKRSFSYLK